MSLGPTDWYFMDRTLRRGEGHTWEAHSSDVLTLVVHGRLEEEFSHSLQGCADWELHYKPRGAVHQTASGPRGVRMFLFGFAPELRERLGFSDSTDPRVIKGGARAAIALAAFLRIREIAVAGGELALEDVDGLAEAVRPLTRSGSRSRPTWITEVHDLLRSQPAAATSLGLLAKRFDVHSVYLARTFRRHYGASVGQVRRRLRVDRAIELLLDPGASLVEVAHATGYADQSHLTREIRSETGWSPGRFRSAANELDRIAG